MYGHDNVDWSQVLSFVLKYDLKYYEHRRLQKAWDGTIEYELDPRNVPNAKPLQK